MKLSQSALMLLALNGTVKAIIEEEDPVQTAVYTHGRSGKITIYNDS